MGLTSCYFKVLTVVNVVTHFATDAIMKFT